MLFEDIAGDASTEEAAEVSPSSGLPFLDAFWQDLLSGPQEAEAPASERHSVAITEVSRPVAERELTIVS